MDGQHSTLTCLMGGSLIGGATWWGRVCRLCDVASPPLVQALSSTCQIPTGLGRTGSTSLHFMPTIRWLVSTQTGSPPSLRRCSTAHWTSGASMVGTHSHQGGAWAPAAGAHCSPWRRCATKTSSTTSSASRRCNCLCRVAAANIVRMSIPPVVGGRTSAAAHDFNGGVGSATLDARLLTSSAAAS